MLAGYTTPQDFLYLALTICIVLLTAFLLAALFHFIRILSNAHKVSATLKDTVELVNHYLWQPIRIALMVIEKLKDQGASTVRKAAEKAKKGG